MAERGEGEQPTKRELTGLRDDDNEKRFYTKWVNHYLRKDGDCVQDLYEDFQSGVKLLTLIKCLTGCDKAPEKGSTKIHYKTNVWEAFKYLKQVQKMKLVGINAESIVKGDKRKTLALIWNIIVKFELSSYAVQQMQASCGDTPDVTMEDIKEEMKLWVQTTTEGYEEVKVANFSDTWKDGMPFCAIIHRNRPDLLDYHECDSSRPLENLEKAFAAAEKMGVDRLIDCDDDVTKNLTEDKVLVYLKMLRDAIQEMPSTNDCSKAVQEDTTAGQGNIDSLETTQSAPIGTLENHHTGVLEESEGEEEKDFTNPSDSKEGGDEEHHERDAQIQEPPVIESTSSIQTVPDTQEINHGAFHEGIAFGQPSMEDHKELLTVSPEIPSASCPASALGDCATGNSDLSEAATPPKRAGSRKQPPHHEPEVTDSEIIDQRVKKLISQCSCTFPIKIFRDHDHATTSVNYGERYRIRGGSIDKIIWLRIRQNTVVVMVGGGFVALEEYLNRHDLCRKGSSSASVPEVVEKDMRGNIKARFQPDCRPIEQEGTFFTPSHPCPQSSTLPKGMKLAEESSSHATHITSPDDPALRIGQPPRPRTRSEAHCRKTSADSLPTRIPQPMPTAHRGPSNEITDEMPSTNRP